MQNGADGRARDKEGKSPLFYALVNKNFNLAEEMISKYNANVNEADYSGVYLLHYFAKEGDLEAVEFLLGQGAYAKCKTFKGETVIDFALRSLSSNNKLLKILENHIQSQEKE